MKLPSRPPVLALALLTLAFWLSACAAPPAVLVEPGSDAREARRLLATKAAAGPVLVTWRGDAPLATAALLDAVERGVRGLSLDATATGEAEHRFVFDFAGGRTPLCADPAASPAGPDGSRIGAGSVANAPVRAAFCAGEHAMALASVEPGGDPERLIWRLVGRLVPDDYPDTYGFDLFGSRFSIGAGATFGF